MQRPRHELREKNHIVVGRVEIVDQRHTRTVVAQDPQPLADGLEEAETIARIGRRDETSPINAAVAQFSKKIGPRPQWWAAAFDPAARPRNVDVPHGAVPGELGAQPRLADTRLTRHQYETAHPGCAGLRGPCPELQQLSRSADERFGHHATCPNRPLSNGTMK